MKIVNFSIARPVTVGMFTIALVLFGAISFKQLSIDLLPDISYPTITVRTEYPGNAPAEIENLITKPVEEAIGVIGNVVLVSSVSRAGVSEVMVEFDWGTNMDFAVLDMREKLDLLRLPEEALKPLILRFDPSQDPIVRYVVAGEPGLKELRILTEEHIKPEIEALDGVAAVRLNGGLEEEIHVDIAEGKLNSMGLTLSGIITRLAEENINLAGGTLRDGEAEYLVRTLNEFQRVDDIGDIVVGVQAGVPVYLRDIAEVTSSHKEREIIIRVNGEEGVELACYREAGRNTVAISERIEDRFESLRPELPAGVRLEKVFDQAIFIRESMNEVLKTAIIGGILAIIILYLFLQHAGSTTVISLAIPISIVTTFFLMYAAGVSLNIMSLGGLALGVGLLVDNSIVVLESINRFRKRGENNAAAASLGTSEVGKAVTAATLTTVAVFLPIVFVKGVAGQLFRDQALTVTFSLLTSLIVALTVIPMLSSRGGRRIGQAAPNPAPNPGLGNPGPGDPGLGNPEPENTGPDRRSARVAGWLFGSVIILAGGIRTLLGKLVSPLLRLFMFCYERTERSYGRILDSSLKHRGVTVLVAVVSFAVSILIYMNLGKELIPDLVQGQFNVEVKLPAGTPLQATSNMMGMMEQTMDGLDGISRIFTTVGSNPTMGGSIEERDESRGQINVHLGFGSNFEREEKIRSVLRKQFTKLPDLEYKFTRPSYFTLKTPVEVIVRGEDLNILKEISRQVKSLIGGVRGVTDIRSLMEEGTPEVLISFDRDRLARMGLEVGSISRLLRSKVYGEVATEFVKGERKIDIRVQVRRDQMQTLEDLRRLIVNPGLEPPVMLKSVADFEVISSPSEIHRQDQQRVAKITANLAGRDLRSTVTEITTLLDERLALGPEYLLEMGGQNREMMLSFSSMRFALLLAIFLVYLVMASQFESFLHPFVILFTIPLSLVGAVILLAITGKPVNVLVFIGTIMLAGIVVNNAIVLVDYINTLRRSGIRKMDAIRRAATVRFRPILMTTATTVLGLFPMALGFGEGGEIRSPMAVTVIGGLIFSTLLTLVVIPVVYSLFEREHGSGAAAVEAVADRETGGSET
ncbi:MAG: efflux RND transporter permease subunit [bacterium]|nr:MAG: efflux RND transporter permease subunit [bacterium]